MTITLSDSYRFPSGDALSALMAKLFALQRREVLAYVASGKTAPIDLSRWVDYFAEKMLPHVLWNAAEGFKMQRHRLEAKLPAHAKSMPRGMFKAADSDKEEADKRKREIAALLLLFGMFGLMDSFVVLEIQQMIRKVVMLIMATTQRRVNTALDVYRHVIADGLAKTEATADLRRSVSDVLADPERSKLIGEDEAIRAFHFGMLLALRNSKLTWTKTWRTADDERVCPICLPLDGVTVGQDDKFVSGGVIIDGAPAHVRCRCRIVMQAQVTQTTRGQLAGV